MSGVFRQSFDDTSPAQETELLGGTDQTKIGNAGDKLKVDGSGVTQPVSAASLPLPTGASTSSLQTTGNTSLSSIDTKTPALGQALAAASTPVVLTAAQVATLTPPTTVTVVQPTGTNLHTVIDNFPATQPISAVSLPLPTGAATAANQATEIASLASIDNGIPAALGQTTMSASMPVVIASDQTSLSITSTPSDGTKATYSAAATNFVPAASATDVFTITGSATKTIRITDFGFSSTTTAGSGIALGISFIKRSTLDTGGTSTTITGVPHDSSSAAATATVKNYTANPTVGTAIGTIRTRRIIVPAAGSNGSGTAGGSEEEFGSRPAQAVVLRGASQSFCINLNGTSITGPVSAAFVEWTEE